MTVAALLAAIAARALLLGLANAAGYSAAYFPAYIIATLYGGYRWGWVSLTLSMALAWVTPVGLPPEVSPLAVAVLFALSGGLTVLVAGALRDALLRNDAANARQLAIQAELSQIEERFRLAQEAGDVGVWEIDMATGRANWSTGVFHNLGLPSNTSPSGRAILDACHPDDRDAVRAGLRDLGEGRMTALEHRVVWPDGTVRWVLARGDFTYGPGGRPSRAFGVCIDVTDRHQAFERVRESEARFRALADSAPAPMWVSRSDGRREFANRAYGAYLGVDYEAALVFDWRIILHPEDADRIRQEQIKGEASRQLFTLEARYRRADGAYRWVRSYSQPRLDPDGEFVGWIGIAVDITEARQAEADLLHINELLEERVRAALSERDEAETALRHGQRLEAMGRLTGGVAHDFNNLLTVVIGSLDIVTRHPEEQDLRARMVDAALVAARRGERLTQQLLAFSRRQALRPEAMALDTAVLEAAPLLRRAVGDATPIGVDLDASGAVVMLDPGQLQAALMNLVVNAKDAIADGGEITIRTWMCELEEGEIAEAPAGAYACVSVEDSGSGMSPEVLQRVFEPFFTTKEMGKGTGLGLSQVYGFARQSGGGAEVRSALGEGSSVRLFLPLTTARPVSASVVLEPPPATPGLNVLLVEDDPAVALTVNAMLIDLGHRPRNAAGVEEAFDLLKEAGDLDLLITDLIMPGRLTGVDLAREVEAMRPGLPILLATGYAGDSLDSMRDIPWPILRKPFSEVDLAESIDQALRQGHAAAEPVPLALAADAGR